MRVYVLAQLYLRMKVQPVYALLWGTESFTLYVNKRPTVRDSASRGY